MRCLKKVLLMFLFTFIVSGCATKEDVSSEDKRVYTYSQAVPLAFSMKDGFYHVNNTGYLYFFDYETKKDVLACSKADCELSSNLNESSQAYIGSETSGFVNGDKLYVLQMNQDKENTFSLIESNLDRSDQKEITEINSTFINSFVVMNDKAYFAIDEVIVKEIENGAKVEEPRHYCYLLMVDLNNGKKEKLTEQKENFNNSISIITANEKEIYVTYSYFDNYFDGTNYSEANANRINYTYNIDTKKLTSILDTIYIENAKFVGKELFVVQSVNIKQNEYNGDKRYTVVKYSLPNYKPNVLFSTDEYPIMSEEECLYYKKDTSDFYTYEFKTEKGIKHNVTNMEDIYIHGDAKEYYYIVFSKNEEVKKGFILKSDYKKGIRKIITVQ